MNDDEKPDAEDIRAFLRDLKAASWLDRTQRHWPGYLFHITNIDNAVEILGSGELLCRTEAVRRGLMVHENANPDIIAGTDPFIRHSARLYFRPRTPTAFRNEGIRPRDQRGQAHVPVPVAFVFYADRVMTQRNVSFSDGSLARRNPERRATIGSDITFLRRIPFEDVYHEGSIESGRENEVTFRRHAEVIVPERLDLASCLAAVRTRSVAELETLRYLLGAHSGTALDFYGDRIASNKAEAKLFYGFWTHLLRVTFDGLHVRFEFNHESSKQSVFDLEVVFRLTKDREPFMRWSDQKFSARAPLSIPLPQWRGADSSLHVRLLLDGCLAYENVLRQPPAGLISMNSLS